jgi:hypothetical protein
MPAQETLFCKFDEPRRERYTVLLAGEGIPHDNLMSVIDQDGEAVAAAKEAPEMARVSALGHGEPLGRDAVRFDVQNRKKVMLCSGNQWGVSQQRRVTLCEEAQ